MDAQAMNLNKQRQRSGRLGGRKQSEKKTAACRLNAAKGGLAHTEAQALASRANGRKGGRPPKTALAVAESEVMTEIFGLEPTVSGRLG
jgi:hypothetical protein